MLFSLARRIEPLITPGRTRPQGDYGSSLIFDDDPASGVAIRYHAEVAVTAR